MKGEEKVSRAFVELLSDAKPDDRYEAVVVLRAPTPIEPRLRGRLRILSERLKYVEEQAVVQRSIQDRVLDRYQEAAGARSAARGPQPEVRRIGSGTLPVALAEVTRRNLPDLVKQDEVLAVLPNQRVHIIQPTSVDFDLLAKSEAKNKATWGLTRLGIPDLWPTTRGEDINIAVLDTGVYGDHYALGDRVRQFVVIDPLGRWVKTDPTFDSERHGTHVCGTIAGGATPEGVAIGVAPAANLLVASVLFGGVGSLSMLLAGITWAVEQGADIVSLSLGFTYYEPHFVEVFDVLINRYGILPVVAIGNENHGNSSSPGSAHNALSVGALEQLPGNQMRVASFSSGASLVFPGAEPNALVTKPDVVAPGVQVLSCIPPETRPDRTYEYTYMDGTSMATPHVAGVAALLMAAKPEAPVAAIVQALKETAAHPEGSSARPDNRWGHGIIRPTEALKALG